MIIEKVQNFILLRFGVFHYTYPEFSYNLVVLETVFLSDLFSSYFNGNLKAYFDNFDISNQIKLSLYNSTLKTFELVLLKIINEASK